MVFDRSKFSGARRSVQNEQDTIAKKFERKQSGGSRSSWHYPVDGKNKFRIAPPHNPEDPSFENYRTCQLEVMCPIYKDGEKTDEMELKKRKIVSATLHHKELSKLGIDGDVVELYVKMIKDHAFKNIKDKEDRKKYLAPINGYRGKGGVWVWGIEPKTAKLAYCWKEGEEGIGKFEMSGNWYDSMQRLIEEMEEDGEPILIDPFSDPDNGYPLVITKGRDDNGKVTYLVDKDTPSRVKKETWDDFFERTKLTDAQLEELVAQKPLAEAYRNGYKMVDFDTAVEGIERFDQKYDFGFFTMDEFQTKVAAIKAILEASEDVKPSEDTNTPKTKEDTTKDVKTPKKAVQEVDQSVVIVLTPEQAEKRDLIAKVITEEYGEGFAIQTPIIDDEIEAWYVEALKGEEAEFDGLIDEDDFVQPYDRIEVAKSTKKAPKKTPKKTPKKVVKETSQGGGTKSGAADQIRAKIAARRKAK